MSFTFRLEPGDTMILASDGAMDALNAEGDFYDLDRFTDSVQRHSGKDTGEFLKSIYSELRQFIGNAELNDDVTLIALRRNK